MIDVVFLLLVFFMLAARFGQDAVMPLAAAGAGAGAEYSGLPRLVALTKTGVRLNGRTMELNDLGAGLAPLMLRPDDTIFVQSKGEADLQQLVKVLDALGAAGWTSIAVVWSQ